MLLELVLWRKEMVVSNSSNSDETKAIVHKGKLFIVNGQDEIVLHDGTKVNMNPEMQPVDSGETLDNGINSVVVDLVDTTSAYIRGESVSLYSAKKKARAKINKLIKSEQQALLDTLQLYISEESTLMGNGSDSTFQPILDKIEDLRSEL